MRPKPTPPVPPVVSGPGKAPKMVNLMRDGLVWRYGAEWPAPHGYAAPPFAVTDIFYDDEDEIFIVFGAPVPPPVKGSPEYAKAVSICAKVPLTLGSAIVEMLIPLPEAIEEVKKYLVESAIEWSERWEEADDEEDDEAISGDEIAKLVAKPESEEP